MFLDRLQIDLALLCTKIDYVPVNLYFYLHNNLFILNSVSDTTIDFNQFLELRAKMNSESYIFSSICIYIYMNKYVDNQAWLL